MSCDRADAPIMILNDVGVSYWRRRGRFAKERFWALKQIDLNIFPGETVGVIGKNGAGKSTLLRLLAGIIDPDQGHITRHCRRMSLLALQAGFNPHLSGRDNILLNGMLLGRRRQEILACMQEIIDFAELSTVIDAPLYSYSTGMRARLGFSVALHSQPEVMLLDEVMGVGDAAFKQKSVMALKARIRSMQTVVIVSHHPQTILTLCDRAVWIDAGRTRASGRPQTVIEQYKDHLWPSKNK